MEGATQEFYETRFASNFAGLTFLEAADAIYQRVGAVLFAVGIKREQRVLADEDISGGYKLVLNPGQYIIKGNEIAFLIASDRNMASQVERMNDIEKDQNPMDSLRDYFAASPESEKTPLLHSFHIDIPPSSSDSVNNEETPEKRPSSSASEGVLNNRQSSSRKGTKSGGNSNTVNSSSSRKQQQQQQSKRSNKRQSQKTGTILPGTYELFHQVKEDINFFREAFFAEQQKGRDGTGGSTGGSGAHSKYQQIPDHVTGHILVCDTGSKFPRNLDCFIEPLRGKHLEVGEGSNSHDTNKLPIVILSPADPNLDELDYLGSKFEQVYFVQGSALDKKSLVRAGVERALKAIVLSNGDNYSRIRMRVSDSSTLFAILNIEAMAPTCFISAELLHAENMKFLGDSDNLLRETYSSSK